MNINTDRPDWYKEISIAIIAWLGKVGKRYEYVRGYASGASNRTAYACTGTSDTLLYHSGTNNTLFTVAWRDVEPLNVAIRNAGERKAVAI